MPLQAHWLVLAGNDLAYFTAPAASDAGVHVGAVIDMRVAPDNSSLIDALNDRGIALECEATVWEAYANPAGSRLAGVRIRTIKPDGNLGEARGDIKCATLAVSAGFMPAYQLACQAGERCTTTTTRHTFILLGLPSGLFIAGSVNSVYDLPAVLADGRNAARSAVTSLGIETSPLEPCDSHVAVNHPWPIFKHPKGREFVDFDEDLQIKDIINSTRQGYRDIQLVKRFSTVGMGALPGTSCSITYCFRRS